MLWVIVESAAASRRNMRNMWRAMAGRVKNKFRFGVTQLGHMICGRGTQRRFGRVNSDDSAPCKHHDIDVAQLY